MFSPSVDGERWRLGTVSAAAWTGVPLVEGLDRAGPQPGATGIVLHGANAGNVEGSPSIHFERACRSTTWPTPRRCSPTR